MIPGYSHRRLKTAAGGATLSILLGVDSVVYGVLGPDEQLLHADWQPRENRAAGGTGWLDRWWREQPALAYPYAQRRLAVDSYFTTLVPERLVEAGNDRLFLQQQLPLPDDLYITGHQPGGTDLHLSYGYPAATKVWLDRHFAGVAVRPFAAELLAAAQRLAPGAQRLLLHVQDGRVHLTFYDGAQLIYQNRFPFQTAKDFLYYTLLVFDQFALSPEQTPIYLSGTLLPDSELYHLLYRYVRHLHLAPPPAGLTFGEGWDPTYAHAYYPLLCSLQT